MVIVTHNMQQAARCSDHTAFMYLGELIEFSNTDDLFTKPAKKQTEDYITNSPRYINAVWSEQRAACCMLWVTITTV